MITGLHETGGKNVILLVLSFMSNLLVADEPTPSTSSELRFADLLPTTH